jgi:hypothetical protein
MLKAVLEVADFWVPTVKAAALVSMHARIESFIFKNYPDL